MKFWRNKLTLLAFTFFFLILSTVVAQEDFDPLESLDIEEHTSTDMNHEYTTQEFDALSLEDKKFIYFNLPQYLPVDFAPENYPELYYEDEEFTEYQITEEDIYEIENALEDISPIEVDEEIQTISY